MLSYFSLTKERSDSSTVQQVHYLAVIAMAFPCIEVECPHRTSLRCRYITRTTLQKGGKNHTFTSSSSLLKLIISEIVDLQMT